MAVSTAWRRKTRRHLVIPRQVPVQALQGHCVSFGGARFSWGDGRKSRQGLIISTGTFTREARAEAQRDGAPPLDLIDGEERVQMLKELRLGIKVTEKTVEEVEVDKNWFLSL